MSERRSPIALDWLNFFMADVETGIGPFVSAYLSSSRHWNPAQIGFVIGAQSMAQVVAQAPVGWLIDRVRARRWLLAGAAVVIALGALLIVQFSSVSLQLANQIVIGIAASFVSPTVAAISLGLVGKQAFTRRVGRNAAFSHGGNVTTALLAGFIGYALGQQWIFYVCAGLGVAVLASIFSIRDQDIDNNAARALPDQGEGQANPRALAEIFKSTRILMFACVVIIFHMANAAMLPLAGQELAKTTGGKASLYMSGCIVTAQFVMVPVSYGVGRVADRIGRKPIFLAAFAILAVRGLLFALGHQPLYIVGVEALDGIGTAVASVLGILVVSDLARGTGRFNFMQGIVQAAVGIGAFLGHLTGGFIAKQAGFPTAFFALAIVAVIGLIFYTVSMPETGGARDQ